ncbi:glycosyltransferase [Ectothiorhodospiraceae bacterium 2226]|nr:glycosyltransferase [Ectothiorhodospiraceae bacterium 2226]
MPGQRALVSVVMPAFNAERYLEAAIQSVLNQSYRTLELLVVDDGSCDGTVEIVRRYARRDARVRLLRQGNAGVAAARNRGLAHARGEYIAPLDADDLWYPNKLALQVACLEQAPDEVGVVYAWSAHINEHGALTGGYSAAQEEGDVYAALVLGNFIGNASATLFRQACVERCGGYDASLRARDAEGCEDADLYLRFARHFRFACVPRLLIGYRLLPDSMSCNWARMARSHRYVIDNLRTSHPRLPAAVRRWSNASFYRYLAWQCGRTDDYWGVLCCLARAGIADWRLWQERRFRQMARHAVRRLRDRAPAPTKRVASKLTVEELEQRLYGHAAGGKRSAGGEDRLALARAWLGGPAEPQSGPALKLRNAQRSALDEGVTG